MDIVNFDALKAQDRIINPSQVDPEEDYFIIGKYTNHYRTNSMKATKYPIYAIKAGDVMGAPTSARYLGEPYLGGVIFNLYKGADGLEHGHVVSLTENASANWSSVNNVVGANRSWDGTYNTNQMVLATSQAKTWVQALGAGWYLPSSDELNILFNNRYYANKALSTIVGATLLRSNLFSPYWTSNESDISDAYFYLLNVGQLGTAAKSTPFYVRGVKSF